MNKLLIADLRKNYKLFFGTFIAIIVSTAIISACLSLVFSATNQFDRGVRFEGVDQVVMANQEITISYKEEDGDIKSESDQPNGRIPLSEEQLSDLESRYGAVPDHTFHIQFPDIQDVKVAGHNAQSMSFTNFELNGELPKVDEIVIDEQLADRVGWSINDQVPISIRGKIESFHISGIAKSNVPSIYELQNYVFFEDEFAKQESIGAFSAGIMTNTPEKNREVLEEEGYIVLSESERSKAEISSIVQEDLSLMVIFITMGAVCLVISLFVISGTVQFSIQNRFRALALLRVLGFKKSQILLLLAGQTFIVGLFAGIIGILLGIPFAFIMIESYRRLGIVSDTFSIVHIWAWDLILISGILFLSVIVTMLTAKKPLSSSPTSAMKEENEFTGKASFGRIIVGIILLLGGGSILLFTPMSGGIGIGMAFCASSLLLGGLMGLTPILMRIFNGLLSIFSKRFSKSLGQVAYANIKEKAVKFAVAAVSITIMLTMGTVMFLNNITFIEAGTSQQYELAKEYPYVAEGVAAPLKSSTKQMGVTYTKMLMHGKDDLVNLSALVVTGDTPNLKMLEGASKVALDEIIISDRVKGVQVGDIVNVYLENGMKKTMTVVGIFQSNIMTDEMYNSVVSFESIEESLYKTIFQYVYSIKPMDTSVENTYSFYKNSPTSDIQLGASLLLGVIAMLLSIVALFNTFAVIMSVRKKEFNGLKVIGAKKAQLIRMTMIEVAIVTLTGILLGLGVLIACVGTYSYATTGVFDWVVNQKVFTGVIIASTILGFSAGMIPSFIAIHQMKRQFRVE